MNYHILKQIINESLNYPKIKLARRVAENKINIVLASKTSELALIIDLQGAKSSITSGQITAANFKSAFDEQLKRCLNGARILSAKVSAHNRICYIEYEKAGAYKSEQGSIVIEFLGRKNNFILLDASGKISCALRYVMERNILQGHIYAEPDSAIINDKCVQIDNVLEYLTREFELNAQRSLMALKANLSANLNKKKAALLNKLNSLASAENLAKLAKSEYQKGELLKANLYKLQDYQRDFYLDDQHFILSKAPSLALKDIFKSAKKLAAKSARIYHEQSSLNEKISQIDYELQTVNSSTDETLLRLSFAKQSIRAKESAKTHIAEFFINDYKISIGLNEAANAALLSRAKKSDWWFHLQNQPGAHAILQTAKQIPDIDIIYQTALMTAAYSGKSNGAFLIDFTQRSKLKRSGGDNSAHVTYNEFDSIKVFLKD